MDALHQFFDAWTAQQDFAWFLAWLAWLGAGACLLAMRNRRLVSSAWVGAVAGQLLIATVAILQHANRPSVEMAPSRGWDAAVSLAVLLQGAGLIWGLAGGRRWTRVAAIVGILALAVALGWQLSQPVLAGKQEPLEAGLLALVLLAGVTWWRARTASRSEAWMAGLLLLSVLAEPHGPLAGMAHEARRWVALSLFALPSALLSLGAGALAVWVALRTALGDTEARAVLRRFWWQAGVVVMVGLVTAELMGRLARADFESGLLARARAFAAIVDTETLSHWLRTRYVPGAPRENKQFYGGVVHLYTTPAINDAEIMPLRLLMGTMKDSDPLHRFVHIATLHRDEILVAVLAPAEHGPKDVVVRHRLATERDYAAWADRLPYFSPPFMSSWGSLVRAWAPVVDRGGRMLGWLAVDASVPAWTVVQAQARLQAFALTALGIVLLVVAERHRLRSAERTAAQADAVAARAADDAKTAFLAQVSHELRTPLQSIVGYSELLRSTQLDAEQRRWLGSLGAQGVLLTRLVEDLLDLTSLQMGVFRVRPTVGDLASTVTAAVEALRPAADQKGLRLVFTISGHATANLLFDEARVRQVVQNLVANAIKFTDAGGIEVALHTTEGGAAGFVPCALSVRDTGCGISATDRMRLFRPFVRLEQTAHRDGTGLGLTLCQSICRAMGGDVEVVSDGSTGSTFTARWSLARARPESRSVVIPSAPAGQLDGLRVLVVDDNPFVRSLFLECLRSRGAEVELAADGEEALARCAAQPFSVVLLDIEMPRLDGYATAARLRAAHPALRLIGVSAHAAASEPERVEAAGMDTFLQKPVALSELLAAVQADVESVPEGPLEDEKLVKLRLTLRQQFSAEIGGQLARLATHVAAGDWADVVQQAHYLKNSADVVQLPALAASCGRLERAAGHADRDGAVAALRAVERARQSEFPNRFRAE